MLIFMFIEEYVFFKYKIFHFEKKQKKHLFWTLYFLFPTNFEHFINISRLGQQKLGLSSRILLKLIWNFAKRFSIESSKLCKCDFSKIWKSKSNWSYSWTSLLIKNLGQEKIKSVSYFYTSPLLNYGVFGKILTFCFCDSNPVSCR